MQYYEKLLKRRSISFEHLPRYYGPVRTNLGDGFVVDLVRDFDGRVSQSLAWHLKNGLHYTQLPPYLDELRSYFLGYRIIFNYDIANGNNVLFQRYTPSRARLVMIDGLGDVVLLTWLNMFPSLACNKIERRFNRFLKKLYESTPILVQREEEQRSTDDRLQADVLSFPQPGQDEPTFEGSLRRAA